MITVQLSSLEDIYDTSSEELRRIVVRMEEEIERGSLTGDRRILYEEYIENIQTELEERKTLEFFQELCAVDNPYLKQMTLFNNQFMQLAQEAIAKQNKNQSSRLAEIREEVGEKDEENEASDGVSVTTATVNTSRLSDKDQREKTYTVVPEKKSLGVEKHMGIGGNRAKNKNSLKDFIKNTLSNGKAESCYVVKKSGAMPNTKPHLTYLVNDRGHLVNPNTLQPISTKPIKSNSIVHEKPAPLPIESNKNLIDNGKTGKQLQKRKKEAMESLKNIKGEKKKEKHLNNKELVEMIRKEESQKEKKEKKMESVDSNVRIDGEKENNVGLQDRKVNTFASSEREMQKPLLIVNQTQNKGKQAVILPLIRQKIQKNGVSSQQSPRKNDLNIDKYHTQKGSKIEDHQCDAKQLMTQQYVQKNEDKLIVIDDSSKIEENPSKQEDKKEEFTIENEPVQTAKLNQPQFIQQQQTKLQPASLPSEQKSYPSQQKGEEYAQQIEQLAKINQEIDNATYITSHRNTLPSIRTISSEKELASGSFGTITNIEPVDYVSQKQTKPDTSPKKCYNQEYWIHIRQEAEYQIQRFKEEKELEEMAKRKIKQSIKRNIDEEDVASQQPLQLSIIQSTAQKLQEQTILQRKGLKDLINDKKKQPKRPLIQAPAKPLYILPTFNYLEIYPTFNHIFSVMYTKAEHQALLDIPNIQKELINMFATHIQHFKDKASYFQPAVFLPFDNNANFSDPRQLLLHAENTHVNLKKIVERLDIFNRNLQGQFQRGEQRYYRVVRTREEVYDIISSGFLRRQGWKELPHGCSLRSSWNLFWSWSKPDIDVSKLLVWQRINHFPFNKNLSRKDLLYRNLDSFRKLLKISFPFLPLTFNLPKEYTQFTLRYRQEEQLNPNRNYWIMKPIGKSRGRGIKVISNLSELNYTENIVVQKYIANPMLIDGYKFDMRIYVLVTSFHPLEAFLYRQGFARLSTEKFSLDPASIKNTFMHLTNFAVNRNNQEAKQNTLFSGGSKISLKVLKDKITRMGYSFPSIWAQVADIVVKSLLGCSISVPAFPTAFQLFGYDIMIDDAGACHLIEINASPSLERTYLIDEVVKQSLIDDILDIIDPPDFDKEQLLDIMSQRLAGRHKVTPEDDLISIARVLKYKKIRKLGEIPQNMGLFQMIAPSNLSIDLQRQIKSRSGANNPRNID